MTFSSAKLGEVADVIDSLHKTPEYSDVGHSMVRCTDVKYGRLSLNGTLSVDDEVFKEFSRRYSPRPNDIIITRVGSYGNMALVEDIHFCLGQNTAAIVPKINSRFLYFALNSPMVKQQIEFSVVGSTQKTLSLKAIKNLDIPRFDPAVEAEIADIVGAIDDRIELNRQINQTLEQISQTIFKSWFVDFDPVKAKIEAKAAGRDPERAAMCAISGKSEAEFDQLSAEQRKQLAATAALFPDELVESELGLIPVGWEIEPLENHVHVKHGFAFKGEFFKTEPTQNILLTPGNFKVGGGFKFDKLKYYDGPIPADYTLDNGDLLLTMTDLSKKADTLGFPAFVPKREGKCFLHNQRLGKVLLKKSDSTLNYFYFFFKSTRYRNEIVGSSTGSTVKHTAPKKILSVKQVFYGQLENMFNEFVRPLLAEIDRNSEEQSCLEEMRDTLLPKLLSGELQPPSIPL